MDLTQIRYFLALARTLNFTRAAEECHVTQPALTKSIQRLEHELGGPLLLRERSLTQLTELGRTMLPFLEQAYGAAQRAKEHASSLRRRAIAPLRLGFAPDVPAAPFIPVFAELAGRLAGFELALSAAGEAELLEALLHSELDAAVLPSDTPLSERLNRWVLFRDQAVALMPPGHALAKEPSVTVAALAGQVVVGRGAASVTQRALERQGRAQGSACSVSHQADSREQALSLAQAGLGIALSTARTVLQSGLHSRPLTGPEMEYGVLVATVAGRPCGPAADAFLKLTRARGWDPLPA